MINYKYGEVVLITFSYPETGQQKKTSPCVFKRGNPPTFRQSRT